MEQFFLHKIDEWTKEIEQLSEFAKTEPHAAYTAFTHGLIGRYTYLMRTLPAPIHGLEALDGVITTRLLPALTGQANFTEVIHGDAVRARNRAKQVRRKNELLRQKRLIQRWPTHTSKILLLSAKGSSSWPTTLPLRRHGFLLSKRDFRDALALRYDWMLENTP